MLIQTFQRSVNLLCMTHTKYYAKRYVHRQLLSKMYLFHGSSIASSGASATGSLSHKASLFFIYVA